MPSPTKKFSSVAESTRSQKNSKTKKSTEGQSTLASLPVSTSDRGSTTTSSSTSVISSKRTSQGDSKTSQSTSTTIRSTKRATKKDTTTSQQVYKRPKRNPSKPPSTDLQFHFVNGHNQTGLMKSVPPDFCSNNKSKSHLFHMVCDHLRTNFGKELHEDVLIDCPMFLIFEMGKDKMKRLRYIVVMDPEVDFEDEKKQKKSGIIIHAVCDVKIKNAIVNVGKMKGIILHFLLNAVIKFKADTLFLSGPFDNAQWLTDLNWLQYDESEHEEDYWTKQVGESIENKN